MLDFNCELHEQADTIRELGVSINTLPHVIREPSPPQAF
jgi:hypothetical protein